jgi:hypothetical protein
MAATELPGPLRRFYQLAWSDRRLFLEASIVSAIVWGGLRMVPFGTLRRALERYCVRAFRANPAPLPRILWAVQAAARRLPGGRTCLVEALSADVMLRRRGYLPSLHLGVRKQNDGVERLDGHAWLVFDNRVIVGAVEDLAGYTDMVAGARTTPTSTSSLPG